MRKYKILSILFCAMMVLAFVPALITRADDKKPYYNVTVPMPGEKPSYGVELSTGVSIAPVSYSSGAYVNGVVWINEDNNAFFPYRVFEAGKKYTVRIFYNDPSGYDPYINNQKVERHLTSELDEWGMIQSQTGAQYYCEKTFTCPRVVSNASVGFYKNVVGYEKPVVGYFPEMNTDKNHIFVSSTTHATVVNIYWKKDSSTGTELTSSDRFQEGVRYFMGMTLKADEGYFFKTGTTQTKFNSELLTTSEAYASPDGRYLYIFHLFPEAQFERYDVDEIFIQLKDGEYVVPVSGIKVPSSLKINYDKSYIKILKLSYADGFGPAAGNGKTEKIYLKDAKLLDWADENPVVWKAVQENGSEFSDVYTYNPGEVFKYGSCYTELTINFKKMPTYRGVPFYMNYSNCPVNLFFDLPPKDTTASTFWWLKNDKNGQFPVAMRSPYASTDDNKEPQYKFIFKTFSADPFFTANCPYPGMTVREFEESLLTVLPEWNGEVTYTSKGPGKIDENNIAVWDESDPDKKDLSIYDPGFTFKKNGSYRVSIPVHNENPKNFSYKGLTKLNLYDSVGNVIDYEFDEVMNDINDTVYSFKFSPKEYDHDKKTFIFEKNCSDFITGNKVPDISKKIDLMDSIIHSKNLVDEAYLSFDTTDTVFKPGNYTAVISLKTKKGVTFDSNNLPDFIFNKTKIDSKDVTCQTSGNNEYTVITVRFTYFNKYIKDFTIDLKEPIAGEKPLFAPGHSLMQGRINPGVGTPSVTWYDTTEGRTLDKNNDEDVFIAGHSYTMTCVFNSTKYIFMGGKVFNIIPYTIINDHKISVEFKYTVSDEPKPSATPTPSATPMPTAVTPKPSAKPTAVTPTPTAKPASKPTAIPSVTAKPSSKPTAKPTATAKPTSASSVNIKLDKSNANVVCGKDLALKATVTGTKGTIIWKSSDSKVAGVDKNGKVTGKTAGTVTISATVSGVSTTCKVTVLYKDVTNPKDFWYSPTNYLTANGVVKGYDKQTNFKPSNVCTRAQMVTFIWRLQGEPAPKTNTCKFKDVKKTDYFYKACIWGNENHIVEGYKDGTFGPQIVCARKHAVTFLWRLANKPAAKTKTNKFKDVNKADYFYEAVLWASEKGIVAGYKDNTFKPSGDCLRRQMVTFLYKYDKFVNGKG